MRDGSLIWLFRARPAPGTGGLGVYSQELSPAHHHGIAGDCAFPPIDRQPCPVVSWNIGCSLPDKFAGLEPSFEAAGCDAPGSRGTPKEVAIKCSVAPGGPAQSEGKSPTIFGAMFDKNPDRYCKRQPWLR